MLCALPCATRSTGPAELESRAGALAANRLPLQPLKPVRLPIQGEQSSAVASSQLGWIACSSVGGKPRSPGRWREPFSFGPRMPHKHKPLVRSGNRRVALLCLHLKKNSSPACVLFRKPRSLSPARLTFTPVQVLFVPTTKSPIKTKHS